MTSAGSGAPLAFKQQRTFLYTGKEQSFTVPSGVSRIRVIAVGGNGGGNVIAYGGRVSAVIPVTPSETLTIYVGGGGNWSARGFNGGGAGGTGGSGGGANGGGASDIREGGNALKDRVVVAGGAGGQGFDNPTRGKYDGGGGEGGASTGDSGVRGCCRPRGNDPTGGGGGTGGTQYQGGSGGKGGDDSLNPGGAGELGSGGGGGTGCNPPSSSSGCGYFAGSGGGGGGGFYGGGGGGGGGAYEGCCGSGGGGGGAGGSSYVERSASDVHMSQGGKVGQSSIVVFYW